jgi:hypothetical protein
MLQVGATGIEEEDDDDDDSDKRVERPEKMTEQSVFRPRSFTVIQRLEVP